MKSGILNVAMTQPLKAPAMRPTSNPIATASSGGSRPKSTPNRTSGCVSSTAVIDAERAAIAATERSMPPVRMTKVWPTATIATKALWRAMFDRLSTVRKFDVAKER